jgi:hypothetical protein
MKRLFASAAIVAIAAIGVPVATAASASAAAPLTGALDQAWTRGCATVTPPSISLIIHGPGQDTYTCQTLQFVGDPADGPRTPALQALCRAMGLIYSTNLSAGGDVYEQGCGVLH